MSVDSMKYGATDVTTSATLVIPKNLGRSGARIQPQDGDVYWGPDASVTVDNGVLIPDDGLWVDGDYSGKIYCIAVTGTVDVRWQIVG